MPATTLRRNDDVRYMLSTFLGATAVLAPFPMMFFLHHLFEKSLIFGFITVGSAALRPVHSVLGSLSINVSAVTSTRVSGLEMPLTLVDVVRSNGPIRLKAVILLTGLMRVVLFVDATTTGVAQSAAGNTVSAGFLDFMGSNMVEGVHRQASHSQH